MSDQPRKSRKNLMGTSNNDNLVVGSTAAAATVIFTVDLA
jgi:hypothetical protein